jgi:hypothetical protein
VAPHPLHPIMKRGEGKDYFTVYDFVKSHHHFDD